MEKRKLRQKELMNILYSKGMLPIKTLSNMLGVSEMTIRRDLAALQNQSYTEISSFSENISDNNQPSPSEYNLLDELKKSAAQKKRIGTFAASLIQKNDVIIIDTGSTTSQMLPYIPTAYDLTVLCYNTNILFHLINKADIKILFCGGEYHKNTEMFEGPESIQFIKRIRANKVFLSAAGVHKELGITCANNHEVPTKRAIIDSSLERILIADSNKFGKIHSSYFCELSDITTIITDTMLSKEWQECILSMGIKLYLV